MSLEIGSITPKTGRFLDEANTARNIIEHVTGAPKFITNEHSMIHSGVMFYAYVKADITAGSTLKLTFTTPAVASGKYVHFRPSLLSCSADKLFMTMSRTPTSVSGGTAVTAYNRSDISTNTALSAIKTGVTLTESAVIVDSTFIGGGTGTGGTRSGSETGEQNEVVLKQETVYSITLANGSSATNTIFLKLLWYEEDGA